MSTRKAFQRFAESVAHYSGRPVTFVLAVLVVVAWAVTGPMFHFGDTWQLVINTGTTIVTFLMVFLIQNTQNRDSAAVQIKLDELIRSSEAARNTLVSVEDMTDAQIEAIRKSFSRVAKEGGVGPGRLEEIE